jgi:acyl carrier protein
VDSKTRLEALSPTEFMAEFRAVVRSVLEMEERHDVDLSDLDEDTLLSSLPIDSLGWTFVIHGLEEAFDVELPDNVAESFVTPRSIFECLRTLHLETVGPE